MSYNVVFSNEAKQDLKEIITYKSQYYASTARNFYKLLRKQVSYLKTMPYMCPAHKKGLPPPADGSR